VSTFIPKGFTPFQQALVRFGPSGTEEFRQALCAGTVKACLMDHCEISLPPHWWACDQTWSKAVATGRGSVSTGPLYLETVSRGPILVRSGEVDMVLASLQGSGSGVAPAPDADVGACPTSHSVAFPRHDNAMDPFEEAYWNQTQVVLWICSRDRSAVVQTSARSCRSGDIGAAILSRIHDAAKRGSDFLLMSLGNAEQQAISKLSGGELRAYGRKNGTGGREAIPAEEWPGLTFYHSGIEAQLRPNRSSPHIGRTDNISSVPNEATDPPFWTDVIFKRDEVLAEWPDLANNAPFSGHRTTITRNVGGRPAKTYERTAIEQAVKWLDDEGEQPLAETARYLGETAAKFDNQGGPSETTLKNWAREALSEFRRMRATLGGN
jgi:hypothetical protein